ncbi:tryptophan synthase subunit alpha [Arhodomonas aquaeolei]|uniref:tryptophan synthase subunit alpha n=1 Tax=Arhodomonas aquaeolei TaxID=2369 RepID=UPI002167DE52|nr:tryptophan synthase subunit alpha [Arhodomonas aquaeolei]MCS4504421.1 tryptophan synthase subunit alpha [Arhodomonas aquaeolei]
MSRIEQCFTSAREAGRKLLIPYITGGDPAPAETAALMHTLVDAGADLIEVGMPFSDPMADGPVIQAACERALAHGTTVRDVLAAVRRFRERDAHTPVVLMGYLNPIEQLGYETFAAEARDAGVDGVLCVDLPPEESHDLVDVLGKAGLAPIWLIAPTTRRERITAICDVARGYVYYVSLKGVTGADTLDVDDVAEHVDTIRGLTALPVGVGFGIRDAATAARVAAVSDAVVVGSAIVRLVGEYADDPAAGRKAVADLVRGMREAMDVRSQATA